MTCLPKPRLRRSLTEAPSDVALIRPLPVDVRPARYEAHAQSVNFRRSLVFRYQKIFLGVGLTLGLACLLQISVYLLAIKTIDADNGKALAIVASGIKDQGRELIETRDELKNFRKSFSASLTATTATLQTQKQVSPSEEDLSRGLDERLARLETALLTRSAPIPPKLSSPAQDNSTSPLGVEYNFDASISLTPGVVIHRNASGNADYWLAARKGESRASRVIPYAVTPQGVAVHGMDDAHNYILTPEGQWIGYD